MLENLKVEAELAWCVLTTRYWAESAVNGRRRVVAAAIALRATLGSVADTIRYREW